MLMTVNGRPIAQPRPHQPVTIVLAMAQGMTDIIQLWRGRDIRSAVRIAVASHMKATPPSNRVSATANAAAAK